MIIAEDAKKEKDKSTNAASGHISDSKKSKKAKPRSKLGFYSSEEDRIQEKGEPPIPKGNKPLTQEQEKAGWIDPSKSHTHKEQSKVVQKGEITDNGFSISGHRDKKVESSEITEELKVKTSANGDLNMSSKGVNQSEGEIKQEKLMLKMLKILQT